MDGNGRMGLLLIVMDGIIPSFPTKHQQAMDQWSLPQKMCQDELQPWHGEGKQLLEGWFLRDFQPGKPNESPQKVLRT